MTRYRILTACALLATALSACGAPGTASSTSATGATAAAQTGAIAIEAAWARPVTVGTTAVTAEASGHADHGGMAATDTAMGDDMAQGGVTSAAYMTIVNRGAADQLLSVSTDVAEAAELHNVTTENNVAKMRPVQTLEVPANGRVEFRPGSYHVMLVGVKETLQPGDTVPLTLMFQHAGQIDVTAQVREP